MTTYLKIGAVIALVIGLMFTHWYAFDTGKDVERAEALRLNAAARSMTDEVKDALAALGHQIGSDVLAGFKGIQVTNQTVVRNIYNEKEIHRVLSDPNCAWPPSTLRVRNDARYDPDPSYRARQRPDAGVRESAAAPSRSPAPAR